MPTMHLDLTEIKARLAAAFIRFMPNTFNEQKAQLAAAYVRFGKQKITGVAKQCSYTAYKAIAVTGVHYAANNVVDEVLAAGRMMHMRLKDDISDVTDDDFAMFALAIIYLIVLLFIIPLAMSILCKIVRTLTRVFYRLR